MNKHGEAENTKGIHIANITLNENDLNVVLTNAKASSPPLLIIRYVRYWLSY